MVCGAPGIDDLSIAGPTEVFTLDAGTVRRATVSPEQFGIAPVPYDALPAGSGEDNAALFTAMIAAGPDRSPLSDLICLNAGAALYCAEAADGIAAGYAAARSAFAGGEVERQIARYRGCR